ncbi:MAG: thioredoxin family protein [Candidatus Micrarchaeia archaeon]
MKIQVLGGGCPKCKMVEENVHKALSQLGIEADIVKVKDINEIVGFGVMSTPALAINGKVKVAGRIPDVNEIMKWIKEANE